MSDSSGATALRTIRALLKQFELGKQETKVMAPYSKPATCDVRTKNFARVVTLDEAGQVVSHAARKGALVVFTFASDVMRLRVQKMCDSVGISSIDLVGPTIMGLSSFLEMDPIGQGSIERNLPLDLAYFKKIDAVEFTMKMDDGALPRNLDQADLVIVAPSRCGKTPLSMYLAQEHNLKVANVPLVVGIPPPQYLLELDPSKVVGLKCHPSVLSKIRSSRIERAVGKDDLGLAAAAIKGGSTDYSSMAYVMKDLKSAMALYEERDWKSFDVTNKAIEESASRILEEMDRASSRM